MSKIVFLCLTLVFFSISQSTIGQVSPTDSQPTKTIDFTGNSSKSFPAAKKLLRPDGDASTDMPNDNALVTYTVDTADDQGDVVPGNGICAIAGGGCTLRAAIQESNFLLGEEVIEFQLSAPATITLNSGTEIVITDDLVINGPGADELTIDGGAGTNRIFSAGLGISLALRGMTITGGNGVGTVDSGFGGAVHTLGDLTLDGMHISANDALICGAVRVAAGTHVIRNTTFSGNTAIFGAGGGLCAVTNSNLVVESSTFSGNTTVSVGGGIVFSGSSLLISNSTIFANTASKGGGGLRNTSSNVTVRSSIIAGNAGGTFPEIYNDGDIISGGFNLIGDSAGDSTNTGNAIIYLSTDIVDTDPRLAPLADNGGPTPTHRLYASSPAVDKGDSFGLMFDQRGFARIYDFPGTVNAGDGADIGAVEILAPTAAAVGVSGRVLTAYGLPIRNAQITISGGDLPEPVTIATGSFGSYSFDGLHVGQTYFLTVSAGRYTFLEPVQTVVPVENVDDLDFVAN